MENVRLHLPILFSLPGIGPAGRKVKIPSDLPILFAAGPIRNAPEWHSEAIRIVRQRNQPIFLACPAHQIAKELLDLVETDRPEYEVFPRQRAWEQYYMYLAAQHGCIFFWLCIEAPVREFPDKVYAHITMLELGKWIERKKVFPETRLVIGTDGKFPEWSTIEYEIKTELPGLPIHYSLKETVDAALTIAMKENGR